MSAALIEVEPADLRLVPRRRSGLLLVASFIWLSLVGAFVILGARIAPHDPTSPILQLRNASPGTSSRDSFPYLLGADQLGRDLLSVLILGARNSVLVAFTATAVAATVGTIAGMTAGYLGGIVDALISRIVDFQLSFPSLLLALFVLATRGRSVTGVIVVLGVAAWPEFARLSRALALSIRETTYCQAAEVLGCARRRILFTHVLANIASPMLVLATLQFGILVLASASLDFLGVGIQPPATSWGYVVASNREYARSAWWLIVFPGLMIFATALSINIVASWLRTRHRSDD